MVLKVIMMEMYMCECVSAHNYSVGCVRAFGIGQTASQGHAHVRREHCSGKLLWCTSS